MADSILSPDSASSVPGNMNRADEVTRQPTTGGGSPVTAGGDSAPGNPTATDPGVTGVVPTGGGKAVPDDTTLEGIATGIGDTGSMDDPGDLGGTTGNQGVDTPTVGDTDAGVSPNPLLGGDADGLDDESADLPTGGLNTGGTVGGTPTGNVAGGMGDEGR